MLIHINSSFHSHSFQHEKNITAAIFPQWANIINHGTPCNSVKIVPGPKEQTFIYLIVLYKDLHCKYLLMVTIMAVDTSSTFMGYAVNRKEGLFFLATHARECILWHSAKQGKKKNPLVFFFGRDKQLTHYPFELLLGLCSQSLIAAPAWARCIH